VKAPLFESREKRKVISSRLCETLPTRKEKNWRKGGGRAELLGMIGSEEEETRRRALLLQGKNDEGEQFL